MRIRLVSVALVALAVGACARPPNHAGRAAAAVPAVTAVAPTTASRTDPAPHPPRGILPLGGRRPAPALRVIDFDGRTVSLEGFRGRPVVVNFFESWCPICQDEQPDLSQVARELSGRVGFIGISYHDTVVAGRAYQRRFEVPYPLANDPSGRTWARWRVPYQPVTVLVDGQGRIAERFDGGTTAKALRVALAYLVGE